MVRVLDLFAVYSFTERRIVSVEKVMNLGFWLGIVGQLRSVR